MTEAEWLTCNDPEPMLEFLRGNGSERKLRLFACACCGQYSLVAKSDWMSRIVGASELFADGLASAEELKATHENYGWRCLTGPTDTDFLRALWAVGEAIKGEVFAGRRMGADLRFDLHAAGQEGGLVYRPKGEWVALSESEQEARCRILRDIFCNPACPPPAVHATFQIWNDSTIPKIAQAIYDERAFDRLPILADALEDAGCNDEVILNHCREPGVHVRGCWIVDLLLGKE